MRRVGLLGLMLLAGATGSVLQTGSAGAVGICKCDSEKGFEQACLPICKEANEKTSFFRPAVYFGDDAKVSNDKSPLNGTSMKFLYLAHPTRTGMERFRQFLEFHRLQAEKKYKMSLRAYRLGKIPAGQFIKAEKVRDEALVNYQHGMRAYLTIPSKR
jgi:hypothetical protein